MLLLWWWLAVCLLCINQCWVLSLDCCTWATELLNTLLKLYHFRFYLTSLSIMNVSCTPLLSYCWFHSTLGPSDRFLYQDYVMLVAHCTQLRFIVLEHASCIIDHVKKYSWVWYNYHSSSNIILFWSKNRFNMFHCAVVCLV